MDVVECEGVIDTNGRTCSNPVQKAYEIAYEVLNGESKMSDSEAIEEILGYLGEYLND